MEQTCLIYVLAQSDECSVGGTSQLRQRRKFRAKSATLASGEQARVTNNQFGERPPGSFASRGGWEPAVPREKGNPTCWPSSH